MTVRVRLCDRLLSRITFLLLITPFVLFTFLLNQIISGFVYLIMSSIDYGPHSMVYWTGHIDIVYCTVHSFLYSAGAIPHLPSVGCYRLLLTGVSTVPLFVPSFTHTDMAVSDIPHELPLPSGWYLIRPEDARTFLVELYGCLNVSRDNAELLADVLIRADLRGHYSHGLNRIRFYVDDIESGSCDVSAVPSVVKETVATALVDGHRGLGPTVAKFCMELAMEKASNVGIGWVVADNSNHYGFCGMWSMMALERGLIGLSLTNTSPIQIPTRAKKGILGTTPITCAIPGENGDSFVLDMASTAVALGKAEIAYRKGESIPASWGTDSDGNVTSDPSKILSGGYLLPLGGLEESGGYKGYGLGMLVELLCGLGNATMGPQKRHHTNHTTPANLGHVFMALNPEMFADGLSGRVQTLMDSCRSLTPVDPEKPVLVAGDPERSSEKECARLGGIPYSQRQLDFFNEMADRFRITPIKSKTA